MTRITSMVKTIGAMVAIALTFNIMHCEGKGVKQDYAETFIPIRNHKACNSLVLAGSNQACLVTANSISGNFIKPNLISTITATVTNL